MDAMIMLDNAISKPSTLLRRLEKDYPNLQFIVSGRFSWHAGKQHISYPEAALQNNRGEWALLHELGHALLAHTDYTSDMELLRIEITAWDKARELSENYHVHIDEEYIQDSLDSYRDWLHVRSTCPTCQEHCLQATRDSYRCHNCGTSWHVTQSRLCRPYRKTQKKSL